MKTALSTEPTIEMNSLELQVREDVYGYILDVRVWAKFTPATIFILTVRASLTLERSNDSQSLVLPLEMNNKYTSVDRRQLLIFSCRIPDDLIKKIENFRSGQDLDLKLSCGISYVRVEKDDRFGSVQNLDYSPTHTYDKRTYTRTEWVEKFLSKLGYGRRLLFEIPLEFPKVQDIQSQALLREFRDRLVRAIDEIERARQDYLNYRNDNVIDRVRESADSIRNFIADNKKELSEALIVKTATASINVSEDLFQDLVQMISKIHDFASKGPHAVTRTKQLMDYRPDREDAEMLLGTLGSLLAYFARKLEKSTP